jgi:glycopeptide antibiotics resistance protein
MIELMKNDFLIIVQDCLPFAALSGFMVLICTYMVFMFFTQILKKDWNYLFIKKLPFLLSFYIYIFLVAGITFLSRSPGSRTEVNLKVFGTISNSMYSNRYVIENILLFIPFGVLFPCLWKRLQSVLNSLIVGFLISLFIEISQYVSQRGYFQVDDMIFNTLGTLVGFYIAFGIKNLLHRLHAFTNGKEIEV